MLPMQYEHDSSPVAASVPVTERAIECFNQRYNLCLADCHWCLLFLTSLGWSVHNSLFFLLPQVGSRMVIIAGACAMLLSGIFGKVGAMLASIPTPVIGGMFLVMFGVITAVGISNLQVTASFHP